MTLVNFAGFYDERIGAGVDGQTQTLDDNHGQHERRRIGSEMTEIPTHRFPNSRVPQFNYLKKLYQIKCLQLH